jgi:hypothetical protein
MPLPERYGITYFREEKLRAVVGGACEVCRERCTPEKLEIHFVPAESEDRRAAAGDLQRLVLVVCPLCHRHLHAMPVPAAEQRAWVRRRPFIVRELMRDILGYVRPRYEPPDQELSDLCL